MYLTSGSLSDLLPFGLLSLLYLFRFSQNHHLIALHPPVEVSVNILLFVISSFYCFPSTPILGHIIIIAARFFVCPWAYVCPPVFTERTWFQLGNLNVLEKKFWIINLTRNVFILFCILFCFFFVLPWSCDRAAFGCDLESGTMCIDLINSK